MVSTFTEMIDDVSMALSGYSMRQDTMTHLVNAISATDLQITLASVQNVGQGVLEIEDELVYVTAVNQAASVVTVAPWGRGYAGTTAVAHDVNVRVTATPTFPRQKIANAINDTMLATSGSLFAVGSFSFTYSPAVTTYELPAEVDGVFHVSYEEIGPSKEWVTIRRYEYDRMADTSKFSSGKTLTLMQYVQPGRTIRVTFSKDPSKLTTGSMEFTATGLPASCEDVMKLGAQYRLLSNIEPGRLSLTAPEADYNSNRITFGSGTNTAKYVYALFQQRLAEESNSLKGKYHNRIHFKR